MKKLFLIVFALTSIGANAQYFQHLYGSVDEERDISGVNTFIQPQGHLMASNNINNQLGTSNLIVTYTDIDGRILGAPNFNNEYVITSPISGNAVSISSAKVFELENGSGFGVVGLYRDNLLPQPGIFYLQLDPMGNALTIYDYTPNSGIIAWYSLLNVGAVSKSPGTDDLYITGGTESSAAANFLYALKINTMTGTILWSSFYDIVQPNSPKKESAADIIESPYMPLGQTEVIIVGSGYDVTSTSIDGFLIRLNANTGIPMVGWANYYGTTATSEKFSSIDIASSTAGGSDGFIIGGTAAGGDFWLIKVDPTGSTIWSHVYDNSLLPGNSDECHDVKERLNTSGNYEYYACGTTGNISGSSDIMVIKTDDLGNGVANGEFTYNSGIGVVDMGYALDQYNGTGADGLSIYGISFNGSIGLADQYLIKAYFNGKSGCNESFSTPNAQLGADWYSETTLDYFDNFSVSTMLSTQGSVSDFNLCYRRRIIGGSNALVAPDEPKGDKEAKVSPNPIAQGTQYAALEVEIEQPTTAQVSVYDMLGRSYYAQTFTLVKGKNNLMLDISNINMAQGMYTVKIQGENLNKNIVLLVK